MPINKRLKRELKKNYLRYMLLSIMVALGLSIISAFISGGDGVSDSLEKFKKIGNIEDASIVLDRELKKEDLNDISDIEVEDNFYKDTISDINEEFKLRVFKSRKNINKEVVMKGRVATNEGEIALNNEVAKANNIDVGDKLKIREKEYEVVGLVIVPDYTEVLESDGVPTPNYKQFGIAFLTKKDFESIDKPINYQYSIKVENDKKLQEINKRLKDKNYGFKIIKARDNLRINRCIEKVELVKNESYVMGCVFVVLVVFIFYVITISSIEKDSALIGTLIAMGYTKKEVVRHYLIIPLALTLVSSVVGLMVGVYLAGPKIQEITYATYSLPEKVCVIKPYLFIMCIVFPFVVQLIFNGIILSKKLSNDVINLLRKQTTKRKIVHIHIDRFSFPTKLKLRIFLRGIKNQIVLFLGILFATYFLIMGLGLKDSVNSYINDAKNNKLYDNLYILKTKVDIKKTDDFSYISIKQLSIKDKEEGKDKKFSIQSYGVEDTKFIHKVPKKGEVIISDSVSSKFNLKKGEELLLEDEFYDKKYKFSIIDIVHESTGLTAFFNKEDINNMIDEDMPKDYYNAIMSKKKLDIDDKYIVDTLTNKTKEQVANDLQDVMTPMIKMLLILAFSMFFIIMYMLLNMIIEKSAYSISLMKIFGYTKREYNSFFINSFFVTVLISIIISIYLDKELLKIMWPSMTEVISGFVPLVFYQHTYIIVFFTAIMVYIIVTFMLKRSIDKVPMDLVLKERD